MKNLFKLLTVLCILLFAAGCSRKNEEVVFDSSDPNALKPGIEWALVTSPYAACHEKSDYEAEVVKHLRRGEIRMVEGTCSVKTDGKWEQWYLIEEGWLPENTLTIYSNKLKAQKALNNLK